MPAYQLTATPQAQTQLDKLPNTENNRLTTTLEEISEHRSPLDHSKCSLLDGHSDVYKVKVGDLRALITLSKPELRVHKVGHRQNFYRGVENPSVEL